MKKHCWSRRARAIGAVIACTGATIFGSAALAATQAGADPGYTNNTTGAPFVGVGSNTIEDLFNAFSGQESSPGVGTPKFYGDSADSFGATNNNLPLHDPTTGRRVYSFDAENPYDPTNITNVGCISTTLGGPAFDRPNGSGNGRKALSDAFDPAHTAWWEVGPPAGCVGAAPGTNLTGQVDFSRSSSGPSGTLIPTPTTATCGAADPCITYIPFARDGLTYAYWLGSGVTVAQADQLTAANLFSIYNTGTNAGFSIGGVNFFACALQTGSGTWTTFQTDIGSPPNAVATGTADNCSALEENSGNDFVAHANGGAVPAANTVWVEPFAASAWIAQANGAAQDRSNNARAEAAPNQVFLGDPDATPEVGGNPNNQPFTGTIPNLVPDATYNGSSTWGRNIYVIVPWHKIAGAVGQRVPAETNIFGNPFAATAVIGQLCQANGEAQSILGTFGFTSLGASGQPLCDAARPTGDTSNHYAYTEALTTGQG
jgi:hypothetical protein